MSEKPRVLVAKRPGGPVRLATKREVCQHWMIPRDAWSGGERLYKCAYCGKAEWRPTKKRS